MNNETIVTTPSLGQKYTLRCRFGRATVKVIGMDDTWATCRVIHGTLRGLGRSAVWGPGSEKPIRIDDAVWEEANSK